MAAPTLSVAVDNTEGEPTLKDGVLETPLPDGTLIIDFSGGKNKKKTGKAEHDANLAEYLDEFELNRIAMDLLEGIDADIRSRQQWLDDRAAGLVHLAIRLENPRSPSADADTAVEGQSTVRWPGMLDAVLRFQANAAGELLPADGPAKIRNDTPNRTRTVEATNASPGPSFPGSIPTLPDSDIDAEDLERAFNHYLTIIDRPFRADTNRMLFMVGYGGSGFKKVYYDTRLKRPISRAIDATDLIVSNNECSLHDCTRITHRITMKQSVFRHMEVAEVYRVYPDFTDNEPGPPDPDAVEQATDELAGFTTSTSQRPQDYKHTLYECYCEISVPGFEDADDIPLPYRVTIDKTRECILEIRRNWREDDELRLPHIPIVKFPFVDGLSFYGLGLLNIMGNATAAVSASWRLALDSAGFASWPGFLYSDAVGRQDTMSMRVGLGAGVRINTSNQPIADHVMPLPYKDVTTGLVQVTQHIEEEARRVGGTPEMMVGEGRQDVPVGTTLAMIDQAVKVLDAVHKNLHVAQAEELELLKKLFIKHPESLVCPTSRPWQMDDVVRALNNCNLVPQSDPNTSSHSVRIMKAVALVQLAQMFPQNFDPTATALRVATMVGLGSINELMAEPAPQAGDPSKMMEIQVKLQDIAARTQDSVEKAKLENLDMQMKLLIEKLKLQDHAAERASREKIEANKQMTQRMSLAQTALVHSEAIPQVQQYNVPFPGGRII